MAKRNDKQKEFCLNYIENGNNGTKAYKDAGYDVTSDDSAAAAASRMLRNVKVQKQLDELSRETTTPRVLTVTQRKEILSQIALSEDCSENERINAIDKLNKMDSLYLQRQEITGAVPVVLADDISD